ncbi:dehydrogenase [Desulfocarbo indianensis]|nr:dehydrogenase [Desulfocarbo indianensis]
MLAVWLEKGRVETRQLPRPQIEPGEALVRVLVVGLCNTDLELLAGYYGFQGVPGHELVGLVEEAPSRPELVGRRVVADINLGCGVCPLCRAGDARHCPDRKALGIKGAPGAMAEYLALPAANLMPVAEGLSDQEAVFAEPLAAALEPAQQIQLRGRDRVLVLGDGKLGLLCALGLRHWTPGLILAGRHPGKLSIAQAQGVRVLLSSDPALGQGGFDLVVEATGRPEGLAQALSLVRPEGVIVAKTTSHEPSRLDLARLVVDEITLLGSRCGDMRLALHFLAERLLQVEPLIQASYPLAQAERAFALAGRPGALKVLLDLR